MVLHHGTRQENRQIITMAGRILGCIGGGSKRKDSYLTKQDPRAPKHPLAGLCGGINAILIVDMKKCAEEGISFWANPSGTVLMREVIPPCCFVSITPIEG